MDIFMGFLLGITVVVLVIVVYAGIATFREYIEDIRRTAENGLELARNASWRITKVEMDSEKKEADDERTQEG